MSKTTKNQLEWHNILRESVGLVPRYYCHSAEESSCDDVSRTPLLSECMDVILRYMISVGKKTNTVNEKTVFKFLCTVLDTGYSKKYRHLFIQSAAVYIERNQHKQFNLKDYRSQIIKHTQRLIEEQKFNRDCK